MKKVYIGEVSIKVSFLAPSKSHGDAFVTECLKRVVSPHHDSIFDIEVKESREGEEIAIDRAGRLAA
jgi:hypothetical protein